MNRTRRWLALPALLLTMTLATAGSPANATAADSEIRDKAALFSTDAIAKAQANLDRVEKETGLATRIETVESLDGANIEDALAKHAKAADAHGLYVLIAKKEHKAEVGAAHSISKYVTRPRELAIRQVIFEAFKKGDFDGGLIQAVDKIETVAAEAKSEAGHSLRPSTPAVRRKTGTGAAPPAGAPAQGGRSIMGLLLTIGLGLLAVFLVLRVLGAIFGGNRGGGGYGARPMGGPGYGGGGPGYGGGGGGGGFMSSLFGGIGGALAGNWLYDQFSGRHHDAGVGQATNYDPGVTDGSDVAQAPETFDTPGDGGADWGAGGGDTGGGGGDWGGGGGGDWGGGGGGGGGDWGGGGGGDWGGGGGDGGGGGGDW